MFKRKLLFYYIIGGAFLLLWFCANLIDNYENTGYLFRFQCKTESKRKAKQLISFTKEKLATIDSIYIFTNDTSLSIDIIIAPNYISNDTDEHKNNYYECARTIKSLDTFINHKDSLGFNILYKNQNSKTEFILKHLTNKTDRISKYQVIQYWDYTKEQKDYYHKKNSHKHSYSFYRIADNNLSKITLTEHELFNQLKKPKGLEEKLSSPDFKSFKTNKFYFFCYNKQLSKTDFKEKVKSFKSLYLKDVYNENESSIRAFKVKIKE